MGRRVDLEPAGPVAARRRLPDADWGLRVGDPAESLGGVVSGRLGVEQPPDAQPGVRYDSDLGGHGEELCSSRGSPESGRTT